MEDLIGKTLGNYQIVRLLGKGGMAAVYLGFQPSMNRNVAIKVMAQQFKGETQFIQRFKNEARVIAQLEHTHILPVYDFGEENGVLYIVMRYLSAGTLEERIGKNGIAPAEVQEYLSQIAPALDYAHSRGVIHRDLKPANVMIDSQGSLFLTDFGIAKSLEDDQKLTATDSVVGTPTYMSPEQGLGEKIDSRSDIYSLGVIVYEMLTGQVPFTADNPMAVMLKHINEVVPAPSSLNSVLTPAIDHVVLRALAKKREDRYATCAELATALKDVLSGKAPAAAGFVTDQVTPAMGRTGGETMPSPAAASPTTTAISGQPGAAVSAIVPAGATVIPTPPPVAPVSAAIPVTLNALSKWLYAHDRLAVWAQGALVSLATLIILARLTEGGFIEIAALAVVPGLLLYSLLRAPTVGVLAGMVLILLPLLVHSPALALIWFVLIVVAGSRLHSREMALVLVTIAAATHPLGVIVPLLAPWWFRGRRTVLPVALGVLYAIIFVTTLGWSDARGLLPGADGAEYARLHLSAFDTSFVGLFDGSVWKAWGDLDGLTNNIVGTLRLLGESFTETGGLPLLIATSWGLAAILSVSNARAESRLLRASGLLLAFVTLVIVHVFNNTTAPDLAAIAMMVAALVLAFLLSQWPIEVDPNTTNLSGTALRMVRQTTGAVFMAMGIAYFTSMLSGSQWYVVLWSLGSAGAIATMTNPLLGPPLAFAAVIITLAGENIGGMLVVTGLLFLYLLVTFLFDKTRPRRWNPLGAGLVLGGPGLAAAGLLPMGVLSIGALEAQVPATLLALAAQGFLIFSAAQVGGVPLNPLSIIIQLLATLTGVLLVERLMAVGLLNGLSPRLRRIIFTVVMGLVLAFAYSVLGGLSPDVPVIQALFVGMVSATVLVIAMGERALYWREFIEHEEKEEEVLEEDEITGARVVKARRS